MNSKKLEKIYVERKAMMKFSLAVTFIFFLVFFFGYEITITARQENLEDLEVFPSENITEPVKKTNETNSEENLTIYKEEKLIKPFVLGKKYRKSIIVKPSFSEYYKNFTTYTSVPEELARLGYIIRLYRIVNGSKYDITNNPQYNISFIDSDGNGLIDKIEWTISEVSEQKFEVEADLTIINVQSYPTIGDKWIVAFTTIGKANLTIRAINGTEFGKDLEFLEVRCGNDVLKTEINGNGVFLENYSCNETGYEVSKVLTAGKHILEFRFGDDVDYAYNQADAPKYSLNSTNSTIAGSMVSHNLFWQDDNGLSGFIFSWCNGTYTKQTVTTYNWTSLDQEPNTRRFNTTPSSSVTQKTLHLNFTLPYANATAWGRSNTAAHITTTGTASFTVSYANLWASAKYNLTQTGYTNLQTQAGYPGVTNFTSGGNNHEPFGIFNFTVPIPKSQINWVYITMTQACTLSTQTEYCRYYLSFHGNSSLIEFGTQIAQTTTLTTRSINITSPTDINNLFGNQDKVSVTSLAVDADANEGCVVDFVGVIVGYNETTITPTYEQNSSSIIYDGIDGSDYQNVDKVGVIVTVSYYNPSASNSTYNNNNRPDLEIAFYDGTSYTFNTTCQINNTMGNNLPNSTAWNCSINRTDTVLRNAWKLASNRRIAIRALWLDAFNQTIFDEINITAVYGYVDAWNATIEEKSCSDSDAILTNDTWIPFSGNPTQAWSNVTKIITSQVGATIKWCVYANDTSNNWNSTSCAVPFSYVTTAAVPPILNYNVEIPASPTTYSKGATYEFKITVNDPNGESDISTVIFEFNGLNETVTNYIIHNSTARNYSITKTDLAANPSGYIFRWYANDSQNAWGNVVERSYVIQKASSSISISFSSNPVNYPTQTTATCQKNVGDLPAILILYRNTSQVAQGSGSSVSETITLGASTWNYTCIYQESENYTSSLDLNKFLNVNKGNPELNILLNNLPNDLEVTYPAQTNATAYENNIGDSDVVYNFYRNTSTISTLIGSGSIISDVLLLGADVYYYVYNTSGGANWTSASFTRILTVKQNTSTLNYMHLVINSTEENKIYTYPALTNTTAWFDSNAFVGPIPTFTLYRNLTVIGNTNPISDVIQLASGFYNYTYHTPGNQNYSSATKQLNLTINKAPSEVRLFLNGTESDATYTYEDYANITATLNVSNKIFYLETNFTGTSQIINWGLSPLIHITNNFGAGFYNITAYWDGDQNYTGDAKTYFMIVNKKPTTLYLWINGSRGDRFFLNKSYVNFTVELVGYPGRMVELWTNYSDGQLKMWDQGASPLQNITQLISTGIFNFIGNYSGNANYSASYESWVVGALSLEARLESLSPKNIRQGENSTVIGNCSCIGGTCNDVYIEIQADGYPISNTTGSDLQVNGSSFYYLGSLSNTWATRSWNVTGWEAGNYVIRIKCNSTETGDAFSEEEILIVNDTISPSWINNFTFPTSPATYAQDQIYWFNLTWIDNVDISTVLIEHNFTTDGSLINQTMLKDGHEYYFKITDLPTGTYVWRSYANDTSNNWNKTEVWIYTISKAPTLTRLFLNGSESNRIYNVSDVANFTVALNISGKIVYLQTNISGWVLQSSVTPLFNYTKLKQKGVFNITGYFLGDENYTASSQTYFAFVVDVESPRYSNLGQNSSWIGVNKSILFFANWSDNYELDYAWLETNETGKWENKTFIKLNLTEGQTWSNFTWKNSSVPAGWVIGWRIYANDSSGNENVTQIMSFVVNASEMWNFLTDGMIFSSPATGDINDDASIDVVFASYDKNVYAVSGKNGTKIWNFSTNGRISSSPSLASISSSNLLDVFIGSYDFNLYALNGSDGSKIWNFSTNGRIFSSPAIADVNKDGFLDVVFGSEDGKVYALNGSDGNLLWTFSTNGKIVSSPAVINLSADSYPIIFIGSYDFNLYALNGSDGSKIWNFSAKEKIESSPAIDDIDFDNDFEVVFGSYDRRVYVLDALTGQEIWNYTTGNWITSSPIIPNISQSKKIIIASHDGNIYCFNSDGSINWTFSIPTGGRVPYLPSAADLNLDGIVDVVVGATDGRIYALNGIDGGLVWSYVIGQYIYSSPAIADLNGDGSLDLTFGSTDKYQYALDPPSWRCSGGNERRTRIFDNSPPKLLSLNWLKERGKKILSSIWREKFSNLDYAIVEENSTGHKKIERVGLSGMEDWVNYSFLDTSFYYKISVFDEYGNSETIEGFVESEIKDLKAPLWLMGDWYINLNYSKSLEYRLNVTWFDESEIEEVLIEHNFTGEFKNESLNEIEENTYSYLITNLPAGNYVWKEYAKDVHNNWNSTPYFTLKISKAQPKLDFYISEEVIYPNPVVSRCELLEGDEKARVILKRDGKEISSSEEIFRAGLWKYSCVYSETQNYSYFEIEKEVEIKKGFPTLNLFIDYDRNSCPARVNLTAYESNIGDEDVTYSLYEKELISTGSEVNYVNDLKFGNYLFIYNSSGGENWTSGQISRMIIVKDNSLPENLIFNKNLERNVGLKIYSLWRENCSNLSYGIVRENSTEIWKENITEMKGNLGWINYTIPTIDLNSVDGCRWLSFICIKKIHFNIRAFDENGNQNMVNDSFTYIFIKFPGIEKLVFGGKK